MHVHVIHQVGHLWHVLDDLVWLSRCISLWGKKPKTIRVNEMWFRITVMSQLPVKNCICLCSSHSETLIWCKHTERLQLIQLLPAACIQKQISHLLPTDRAKYSNWGNWLAPASVVMIKGSLNPLGILSVSIAFVP